MLFKAAAHIALYANGHVVAHFTCHTLILTVLIVDLQNIMPIFACRTCQSDVARRVCGQLDLPDVQACGIRLVQPFSDQLLNVREPFTKNVLVWDGSSPS